jgi:Na+/phosphate symporter
MRKELTTAQSVDAQVLVRLSDEMESTADYIEKLSLSVTRFSKEAKWDEEAKEDFERLLRKVKEFYFMVYHMIENADSFDKNKIIKRREEIKLNANEIREKHMIRMAENRYEPVESALTYSDLIVSLRKIAAHTSNIAHTYSRVDEL